MILLSLPAFPSKGTPRKDGHIQSFSFNHELVPEISNSLGFGFLDSDFRLAPLDGFIPRGLSRLRK